MIVILLLTEDKDIKSTERFICGFVIKYCESIIIIKNYGIEHQSSVKFQVNFIKSLTLLPKNFKGCLLLSFENSLDLENDLGFIDSSVIYGRLAIYI